MALRRAAADTEVVDADALVVEGLTLFSMCPTGRSSYRTFPCVQSRQMKLSSPGRRQQLPSQIKPQRPTERPSDRPSDRRNNGPAYQATKQAPERTSERASERPRYLCPVPILKELVIGSLSRRDGGLAGRERELSSGLLACLGVSPNNIGVVCCL